MTDASKFLNYGDQIYVHSAEIPKSYLSARSILEEKVFFIKSPPPYSSEMIEEIDSTFYENQAELVFTLYPKLNYQAYKNFTKLKPNDDPFKIQLFQKRLDVELDQNQKLIDKMMGTPVTFGSEIQLLHVSSDSYIRATREKNPIKNELYELRLSKKGGSGMYFKIIPYLSFKKEGEKISLKDFFYLENTKLQASIVYKNIPRYPYTKDANTSSQSDEVNFDTPFNSQAAHRNYMPLMELSSTFEKYEAGLKQQDLNCPLGVRLVYAQKSSYAAKTLTWGSYVRLKFMLNTKQTGYFYSDHTIIGGSPDVYCRIVNTNNIHERESFQAIFQLIPISEDLYGTPILFEDSKEIFIRLRHLLTGRYLQIGSEKLRCCLSESLDTFLATVNIQMTGEASPKRSSPVNSRRRRNSQIRKERSSYLVRTQSQSKLKIMHLKNQPSQFSQKAIRSEKSGQPTTDARRDDSPVIRLDKLEHITSQYVKPESNSNHETGGNQEGEDDDKNVISKFFEKTSIRLRNASQDDEGMLTSDSVFALESIQLDSDGIPGSLTVNPHDKEDIMNQVAFTWMKTAAYADDDNIREYFKPRFHVLNPLDKEEFEAQISSQNNIFFHFAMVGNEEISQLMAVHSRLYPLINLTNMVEVKPKDLSPKAKQKGNQRIQQKRGDNATPKAGAEDVELMTETLAKILNEATDCIRKFSAWLTAEDPNPAPPGHLGLQVRQKMAREVGLVDILLDLLMQLYTRSLLKTNTKTLPYYKFLTQDIFNLLQAIIRKNRANNIYIFQWSKLLEDMTLHPRIPNDLGVDKLLSQIFYENITQIDELKEIPAHLDFSEFDLKALNIAIALYRYNPIRPSEEKDRIIETLILKDENRTKIFPTFEQDEEMNIMVLDDKRGKILKVEPSLEYKDKKLFDFCTGVINLATEITKSKPQVVYSYLQDTIPVKLCISLFENRKWNYLFRSALLDLFTELYVSVESVFIDDQSAHSKIKLLNNVDLPENVGGLFDSRKRNFLQNFVNDEFNIKRFISDFLTDKHKWTDDEHKYVYSVLKLVHAMCRKGLYEDSDLLILKQALYSYLQVGLATIHAEISPETKPFDIKIDLNAEIKIVEKKEKVRQKTVVEKPKKGRLFSLRKGSVLEKARTDRGKVYEQANEEPENEEEQEAEEVAEKGDPYWKKGQASEMITWMNEALKIIEYIEIREMDKIQKDFFKHDETLKFFNEKLLSNNDAVTGALSPETIAQIKQDKEAYALSYINNNLVLKDCKNQLLLIELLNIKNPVLTSQIVHLLYLSFSKHKDFLNALNNIQVIYPENLGTYCFYLKLVDTLRLSKVRLDALYGEKAYSDGEGIYETVDTALKDLLEDLFADNLNPSSPEETEKMGTPGPVYEIYDGFRFEATKGREKQSLLRNLSYFQTVTQLFVPLVKGHYCKTGDIREKYLKNFLHFYVFLCVNNPTNQKLMTDNQEFMKTLLLIEYPSLQPLLLRVVSEMYRDNFSLLIQISQNSQNIITLLLNKFFQRFSYEELTHNDFFIMCLRVFPTFFQIKNNFLTQNQVYFAKQFYSKVLEKPEQHNINNILTMKLYRFLSTNKLEDHVTSSDPHAVQVPFEISFAIYFLNTFSMMVAGNAASNSVACLTNKYYLSIKDIYVLLKAAGDWFNLKLALVTFLNNVYIKNKKLEDNELTELYNIVRECMFEELNEYNRFLRNRHLYARSHHQRFVSAFDAHYPIVTEFSYKEIVDEVYHQYILHGVMDTFLFYALRLKTNPSENDHAILDDYVSSSLNELKEFWQPGPNQKRNFQLDMEMVPIKNKMIVPIDEPSDGDILDGDLLVPQLNERKKANQLQKEIKKATMVIRRKERVRAFKVFPTEYVNWLGQKSIKEKLALDLKMIETKHNMELEILVKILLHIRLESPKKFHTAMQSFMNVLGDEDGPNHIKQAALNVIRKLSNFKANAEIYEKIQMDLVQLKFIDFFDDVIVYTKNEEDRLEFLLAMIDFLDEASLKVQQELHASLVKDEQNLYLETIKKFILSNFEDFRENEKNFADGNSDDQYNAKSVVYKKMYRVIYALEMLRLSCENHFEPMQHFLREQIQTNGRNKKSINFINLISDIFNRYTKSINEKNAVLGLKILDTLTEMLQGPCIENQVALCNAKILENLEDLIVEVNDIRKKKESLVWTEMNNKILILIAAILEGASIGQLSIQGTSAAYIVGQVSIHINASFFLERMEEIYNNVYKQRKKAVWKNTKIKDKNRKGNGSQALVMSLAVLEAELVKQEAYKHPEGAYKAYINEGVQFGIVLYTLAHLSPDIRAKLEDFKLKIKESKLERYKEIQRAEMFYHKQIGQVEIVNKKGELQRIYFPIIDKIKFLSSVTKDKFLDEVNRESANEKLFGLVRYNKLFEDEMNHFEKLRRKKLKLSLTYFSRLRDLNLLIAFATNIIILFESQIANSLADYKGSSAADRAAAVQEGHDDANRLIKILGIVHIVLCSLVLIFWGIFQAPLDINKSFRELESKGARDLANKDQSREKNKIKQAYDAVKGSLAKVSYMLFDTYLTYLILFLLFAILGTGYSKVFFGFLLFDLIDRSVILNNVIKSVTVNYKQLLMTAVLGILIMYVYAVLGFFAVLNGEIAEEVCDSVFHCFLFMSDNALRAGGGVGDALSGGSLPALEPVAYTDRTNYERRYFYDLFYFLIIIIMLLNIIFGIIIDTFADLRDQKTLKDYDEKNQCFICNLERTAFEKKGESFEVHTKSEHFVWNYVYYLIYLRTKNKLDFTGTESYVYDKFENEDLSWFPIQRALSLINSDKEEEEDVKAMVEEKLSAVQKKILDTIASTGNNQQMMQMGNLQLNASRLKSRARKANHRGTYMVNN